MIGDLLRNLRVPGRRARAYRGRAGSTGRGVVMARPGQQRQYALGRVERPKPKREIHVPWRRIGFTAAGVGGVLGVLYGAVWLLTGDMLRVQEIDITGAEVADPYEVAAAAGLGGDSMLMLDLDAADAAIEAIPVVESATVTRDWPHGLRITIEEHQAWGYWQAGGRVYVVDEAGQVLEAYRPAPEDAPTIIDVASPRDIADGAVADADTVALVARLHEDRMLEEAGMEPTAFVFQRDRGLTVVNKDGPAAVFGDSSNYEFKVQAFEQVLRQLQARGDGSPQVSEIDLRFGRNVVLR